MQSIISTAKLTPNELQALETISTQTASHVLVTAYRVEQAHGRWAVVRYKDVAVLCQVWESSAILKCYLQAMGYITTLEGATKFSDQLQTYLRNRPYV